MAVSTDDRQGAEHLMKDLYSTYKYAVSRSRITNDDDFRIGLENISHGVFNLITKADYLLTYGHGMKPGPRPVKKRDYAGHPKIEEFGDEV